MSTELYEAAGCQNVSASAVASVSLTENSCRVLTTQDYIDLLWTTLAEFPGHYILNY